jgi:hypothetical protein
MRNIPVYKLGKLGVLAPFKFAKNPLQFLHQGFETCGDTFQMKLFREFVVSRDPGFFRHVLQQHNRNFKKGSSSKMLRPVLGNGLVTRFLVTPKKIGAARVPSRKIAGIVSGNGRADGFLSRRNGNFPGERCGGY